MKKIFVIAALFVSTMMSFNCQTASAAPTTSTVIVQIMENNIKHMIENLDVYISEYKYDQELEWWMEQRNELQQKLDEGVDINDAIAIRDQLQYLTDLLRSKHFHSLR